ncbi:Ger(x)C family spore germination protein [Sporosarcina sp. FSL K6-1522]|uniref:Ger(x)C family spore germination protein n=1 Tax=Sporosarcina sp. FSL K6-1522 TaxID=2921554 RepID=UPI003159CF38
MRRFLFIICLSVLAGCSQPGQRTSVEDLAMASSMAFDVINDEEMRMTVSLPHPSTGSKENTQTYSADVKLIQEGLVEISTESDKMILLNQLRTILFSEDFARTGRMAEVVEHFYRNSTVGNNVRLAIVKEQAEDVLRAKFTDKPNMDSYLNDLLQPKLHTSFSPFTTIHDFQYSETNPVFYSQVPYFELKKDSVKIVSIALFDSGKMIDTISSKQSSLIQALKGLDKLSPLALTIEEGGKKELVHIELIKNKAKITSNKNLESPKLSIYLSLQGALYEYKGDKDLGQDKEYKELEKAISQEVQKEVEKLLKKLRQLEVDPIGLSEYFRMYYDGKWTEELTKQIMMTAEYEVTVDFNLLNTGTLK